MQKIRLLTIGAHPDDCDIKTGGIALQTVKYGGKAMFVSATNGNAGHHLMTHEDLKKRRYKETQNVAETFGITYKVLDNNDGYLQNTIENRDALIRIIRSFKPDVIVTHRSNDYHTDHRNTSLLVQDASFLLRVPLVCPDTPALEYSPVILYMSDGFLKPVKFNADLVVDIEDVNDDKINMIHLHESQIFEWLPWLSGTIDKVPTDEQGRLDFTRKWMDARYKSILNNDVLKVYKEIYGLKAKENIKYVEAFEISEYGNSITVEALCSLFTIR